VPLRFARAGDFHLDEDRYFADTAQYRVLSATLPKGHRNNAVVDSRKPGIKLPAAHCCPHSRRRPLNGRRDATDGWRQAP
jgi:hypothetical protein